MVPREQVYTTRISLSGEGLPTASEGGYSLLDDQSLSTSQFQEQTSFKRAMEGELSNTIEAIDGVETAVVHLAMPAKQVFSDEQDPTTASVLVKTRAGSTLDPEQVQAIVNLVSSSVDGLEEDKVTVADSTGKVLSAPGGSSGGSGHDPEPAGRGLRGPAQRPGPGDARPGARPGQHRRPDHREPVVRQDDLGVHPLLRQRRHRAVGDRVQRDARGRRPGGTARRRRRPRRPDGHRHDHRRRRRRTRRASAPPTTPSTQVVEHREAAPGGVESLHVGVVIDTRALRGRRPDRRAEPGRAPRSASTPSAATPSRSRAMPFDRTAEAAAAEELEASRGGREEGRRPWR